MECHRIADNEHIKRGVEEQKATLLLGYCVCDALADKKNAMADNAYKQHEKIAIRTKDFVQMFMKFT